MSLDQTNEKIIINKIVDLYKSIDGNSGGYGYMVFDDDYIETHHILWCLREAEIGDYEDIREETRLKSIIALKAILPLSEEDRQKVIDMAFEEIYK